jgi:hypothetical protein
MQQFDQCFSSFYTNMLENVLTSQDFPWYLNKSTVSATYQSKVIDKNTKDNQQFVHVFFNEKGICSNHFHLITPIIAMAEQKLEKSLWNKIVRVKANLVTKELDYPDDAYNTPHLDTDFPSETLLYYVNDSDGDTLFFNESIESKELNVKHSVKPQKGSMILFDNTLHAGKPPKSNNYRVVINFIFKR